MLETAGTKLRRKRLSRQLGLEDAARQTRISAARLGDLEADEYSNFPNLAYAKSFLRSYSRFLDVDLNDYLDAFEDVSTFGMDDYQYLSDKPMGLYRISRRPQHRRPKLRRSSVLVTAAAIGMCVLFLMGWFFYMTYQRLGGDLHELADRQEAREHGLPHPGTQSPAKNSENLLPASATPVPATASPSPQPTPSSSDNMARELVATTLAESSPVTVLKQLAAPAANLPAPPTANPATGTLALQPMMQKKPSLGNTGETVPANNPAGPDGKRFYVRRLDNNPVEVFRTGVPHPQKPAPSNAE